MSCPGIRGGGCVHGGDNLGAMCPIFIYKSGFLTGNFYFLPLFSFTAQWEESEVQEGVFTKPSGACQVFVFLWMMHRRMLPGHEDSTDPGIIRKGKKERKRRKEERRKERKNRKRKKQKRTKCKESACRYQQESSRAKPLSSQPSAVIPIPVAVFSKVGT